MDPIHFRIEVQELEGTDNFGKPIAEPVLSYLTEHTQPRKAPFGKHARTALLILEEMYKRYAANLAERPGAKARVVESDWQAEFYSSFAASAKPGTRRMAWSRAIESLTLLGKVRIEGGFAYLTATTVT